jgi:hypothetical protein
VVSLQARNQVSKPSTELELLRWPREARSTTCEQYRCVCVCVILHISSRRYGRIVTLFLCINDDRNLCVILHLKRHACVIISVQYNFLYDLPTHLQAWRISHRGLANPCLFWCNLCVCVWFCISRVMLVWLSLWSTIYFMIYLLTCKACNLFIFSHILLITKAARVH